VNPTEEEEAEALATPLLAEASTRTTEVDEFGAQLRESLFSRSGSRMAATSSAPNGGGLDGINTNTMAGHSSVGFSRWKIIMRGTSTWCLRVRTLADVLPAMLQPIVSNGKMSVLVFLGGQFVLLVMFLPFWILSFLVSEAGVYGVMLATIVLVGRGIIRMIAFPGSSHRVTNEIEREFTKYSVRVITVSADSLIELTEALQGASVNHHEIVSLWKRARSYRDRVLGVYAVVLHTMLEESSPSNRIGSSSSSSSQQQTDGFAATLNQRGNNALVGDVGNLSGLTSEAIDDGRVLLNHLETVLQETENLEVQGKSILEYSSSGSAVGPSNSVRQAANAVMTSAIDLRNFVESLRPPPSPYGSSSSAMEDDIENSENGLPVNELRRMPDEEQSPHGGSITETIRTGLSSILPMLDPPLHSSIFGFDVLRGCVLSRYKGARQLWVQRPSGGRIDCLHIPSVFRSANSNSNNSKAVLYCNPNAGLIEVATGMSLAGGNVASDTDNVVNDNCWTDFYTNAGFDVYLYNYAGFGRSHGQNVFGLNAGKYTPGKWGRVKRILYGLLFGFRPNPDSLREDGFAVASHILSHVGVGSLVIHGESIGGLAASGTARKLTENHQWKNRVSLLLCDRTFCNLEAVAQRLVGGWSGYAIRMLAPFWSTDVVGDFLAATCPKVVATDAADAIIADSSSLKAGISFWKEIQRSNSSTKGIGWKMDAPLHYKMADWENISVTGSRYVAQPTARITPPMWPSDKHITLNEAFHFAACAKRIGKLASIEKRRFSSTAMPSSSSALNETEVESSTDLSQSCQVPIYLVWKYLGCCEGLCGSALGVTVKGGFDTTVSWLSSMCVFGGQTVVEGIEHRHRWSSEEARTGFHELGAAKGSDFDCRPSGYEQQESDVIVHPKPVPEVLEAIRKIVEDNPSDHILNSVTHEISFVLGTLEYVVARLSASTTLETSWKSRHLVDANANSYLKEGSFLNLHCGHNNPYSAEERKRLRSILDQATQITPLPAVV